MFVLERLADARARGAKIYGEVVGYAMNSDATDFVLPDPQRQADCIRLALRRAGLAAEDVDIVSTHATGTTSGDAQECDALRRVWAENGHHTAFNNTKSFIGHAMGAAGALELAGNLPAFDDGVCHATINLDRLDPGCALPGLVAKEPRELGEVDVVLNNSFGMLGINSAVIVKRL
jgi:3-oxoacyl-[acyl-carrier-protein] synthase II